MIKSCYDYGIKLVLGGYAFSKEKGLYKQIGGDIHLNYLEDIFVLEERLKEEVNRR